MSFILQNIRNLFMCLGLILGISMSATLYAQPAADAPVFASNTTLAANLKNLAGKRVTLYLKSGTSLSGVVKSVGDHLVHLEKLDNKDFFDALILMEQIAAMDTRARSR